MSEEVPLYFLDCVLLIFHRGSDMSVFYLFNLFNFPIFTLIKRPSKWYKQTKMNSSGLLLDLEPLKLRVPSEFRTNKTVFDVNLYLALGGWFLLLPLPSLCALLWLVDWTECGSPIGQHWPLLPAEDQRSSCEGGRRPGSRKQARRRFVKRKIRNDEMMISRPRLRVSIWPLIGSFKKPEHTFWMCPKMFQEIDTFEIKIWGTSIIHVKNVRGYNENILTQNQAFLTVVIVSRRDRV